MISIYYFKKCGRCKYTRTLLEKIGPRYLMSQNAGMKYYANLEWLSSDTVGVEKMIFTKYGARFVNNAGELPDNAGILLIGYEGDVREIEEIRNKGVPILNRSCPWTSYWLKNELKRVKDTHQLVWMIEKDHVVYRNYQSLIPKGSIIVDLDNYQKEIVAGYEKKPIHFINYCTFRPRDVEKVTDFIKKNFNHPDNIFYGNTFCFFIKSGLFEEIREKTKDKNLKEIWVVTGTKKNLSLQSIINEIGETGTSLKLIYDVKDIPDLRNDEGNIGVLIAPMPFSKEKEIINAIRSLYPGETN
jgi:4-hydroxy-3-methylbut-2-enyl diphosphate reductase IspH